MSLWTIVFGFYTGVFLMVKDLVFVLDEERVRGVK